MDTTIHTTDADVKKIALAAFPDYKGRKFTIKIENGTIDVRSYWSGGSRDYFVFLRLDNLKTFEIPQQSVFDKKIQGADAVSLLPGVVCVEHSYFCGKDMGITIYVHPDNAPTLITEKKEITRDEKIVLVFTRTYKNTYGGRTNIRFYEANRNMRISLDQWNSAVQSLKDKKLLNAAGSITNDGRNAIGDMQQYSIDAA